MKEREGARLCPGRQAFYLSGGESAMPDASASQGACEARIWWGLGRLCRPEKRSIWQSCRAVALHDCQIQIEVASFILRPSSLRINLLDAGLRFPAAAHAGHVLLSERLCEGQLLV